MAKKLNAWMAHVADVRKQHPGLSLMEILKKAKASYKKPASSSSSSSSHKKHGGAGALGGPLSPSDVAPGDTTSDANIQIQATTFSGGKKSKRRGSNKKSKRCGSKRSGSKRSGSKKSRRH